MSKSYKRKHKVVQEEIIEVDENALSKKELYDLNKKKKELAKDKEKKKKNSSKKGGNKKTYQTNLAGRIFAFVMLILMVGSVIATIASYVK